LQTITIYSCSHVLSCQREGTKIKTHGDPLLQVKPHTTKKVPQKTGFFSVRETGLRNRLEAHPAEHTAVCFLAQTAAQTDQY